MTEKTAKFQPWQQLECAWCDRKATGNALHTLAGYWLPACVNHGRNYEPFEPRK